MPIPERQLPQVLSLISAFLAEHRLNTTNRALVKELKRKGFPDIPELSENAVGLHSIVKSWQDQEAQASTSGDDSPEESDGATSDSGSDTSSATTNEANQGGADRKDASESGSESESEEEITKAKPTKWKRVKVIEREASLTATSSSSSDSDADDEDENISKAQIPRKNSTPVKKQAEPRRNLKRKAESNSPKTSPSESESPEDDRPAKRKKLTVGNAESSSEDSSSESRAQLEAKSASEESESADISSSEEEDSSDTSSDEEEEEESKPVQPKSVVKMVSTATEDPSDSSSNTVMGDVVEREEISAKAEEPRSAKKMQGVTQKKHVGARPTPLAQLSAHATADNHISNAYRSYDYAERAYNDLSVTRGKGFTKEKNKKKRGSYRGGAIDISGGKGFKFDD